MRTYGMRVGRPRGRTLDELELQHLQLLLESRERIADRGRWYDLRLEDFVLQLREDGASAHSIAEAAGVSAAAVQKWTQHARTRRDTTTGVDKTSQGENEKTAPSA